MSPELTSKLEKRFGEATDSWLKKKLQIKLEWKSEYLHYTQKADEIVAYQIHRASFIRSTSDPLEYVLPLAAIRNWVCYGGKLFKNFSNPDNLFNHFNELAENPVIPLRPYFISLTEKPSAHLSRKYGPQIVGLKEVKDVDVTGVSLYLTTVTYHKNPQEKAIQLVEDWQKKVLHKVWSEFNSTSDEDIYTITFYFWMKVFSMIALSVKDKVYSDEAEVRAVIFTAEPELEKSWHLPRMHKASDTPFGAPRKECLPIKLAGLGLQARKIK